MTNWGNEHFSISNMMGMHSMMPNTMGSMQMIPQMMSMMMPDMNNTLDGTPANSDLRNSTQTPLIGPVFPEGPPASVLNNKVGVINNEYAEKEYPRERVRDRGSDYRRNKDRGRPQRSRSRDKDQYDRSDRNSKSTSRWGPTAQDDNDDKPALLPTPGAHYNPLGNMIIPGMMQVGNMIPNMMSQQPMDVANMAPMMQGITPNMIPNMTDQNIMLINQQMIATQQLMQEGVLIPNQPIFVGNAVLLPPLPNMVTPNRREKPLGCRTIFVGGLPSHVNEDTLKMIFQRFGEVVDLKIHKQGFCHIRFGTRNSVDYTFALTGYRFKYNEQSDNEATTLLIDYALNRDDQNEYDQLKAKREYTPPRIEPLTPANLSALSEKIKNEEKFAEAAPTLTAWLERGECNKRNAYIFYSLIQATNNQVRRLYNEKMQLDDEFMNLKSSIKDKYVHVLMQFEQVVKIFSAAKHQRVSDHFNKQQRRNIEIWLKMSEDVDGFKEEFNMVFEDEAYDKIGKKTVSEEKYEELKVQNENLMYELEGYKNEGFLAKSEAERKFEKFKAHFIAQQALQSNSKQIFPPLPLPPLKPTSIDSTTLALEPESSTTTPSNGKTIKSTIVPPSEAKLISILTAFLMVHPLGATLDYLVSYVKSLIPSTEQTTVNDVLHRYSDIFSRKTTGVGAFIEHKWTFVTFDSIKEEVNS